MPPKTTTTSNIEDKANGASFTVASLSEQTDSASEESQVEAPKYNSAIELSPLELEKVSAYKAEIKKNNNKAKFWTVSMFSLPVFLSLIVALLGFYMGIFSNYLMQVSGPMGSIQKDLETKQRDIERLEQEMRDLRKSSTESVVPAR